MFTPYSITRVKFGGIFRKVTRFVVVALAVMHMGYAFHAKATPVQWGEYGPNIYDVGDYVSGTYFALVYNYSDSTVDNFTQIMLATQNGLPLSYSSVGLVHNDSGSLINIYDNLLLSGLDSGNNYYYIFSYPVAAIPGNITPESYQLQIGAPYSGALTLTVINDLGENSNALNIVPEPGIIELLAMGTAMLGLKRRYMKGKK